MNNVELRIRDNTTGEICFIDDEAIEQDGKISTWAYEEGNYSCDCNRHILFTCDTVLDYPCGYSKYAIQVCAIKTGDILYDELNH